MFPSNNRPLYSVFQRIPHSIDHTQLSFGVESIPVPLADVTDEVKEENQQNLTPLQINNLKTIIEHNHAVSSDDGAYSFFISAKNLLLSLLKKFKTEPPTVYPCKLQPFLIGSKAGSLFVTKETADTDILLKIKISLSKKEIQKHSSPAYFLHCITKKVLDYTRDSVEEAIKLHFETSSLNIHKKTVSLKEAWQLFIKKRKIENTPVLQMDGSGSNRYGMLHIGHTLEIKYVIEFLVDEKITIPGLLHDYAFSQDDLKVELYPLLQEASSEATIRAFSSDNSIAQVIQSLKRNELITEQPDASKFIPHLLKFTLRQGLTSKDNIQENLKLLLNKMPMTEFESRFRKVLQEKPSLIDRVCCIINARTLLQEHLKSLPVATFTEQLLENLLKEFLHEQGQQLSQQLPIGALLDWCQNLLLLSGNSHEEEMAKLNHKGSTIHLFTPSNYLILFKSLFKHKINNDIFLELYKWVLPSLTFNESITTTNELLCYLYSRIKEKLEYDEGISFARWLSITNESVAKAINLQEELKKNKPFSKQQDILDLLPENAELCLNDCALIFYKLPTHLLEAEESTDNLYNTLFLSLKESGSPLFSHIEMKETTSLQLEVLASYYFAPILLKWLWIQDRSSPTFNPISYIANLFKQLFYLCFIEETMIDKKAYLNYSLSIMRQYLSPTLIKKLVDTIYRDSLLTPKGFSTLLTLLIIESDLLSQQVVLELLKIAFGEPFLEEENNLRIHILNLFLQNYNKEEIATPILNIIEERDLLKENDSLTFLYTLYKFTRLPSSFKTILDIYTLLSFNQNLSGLSQNKKEMVAWCIKEHLSSAITRTLKPVEIIKLKDILIFVTPLTGLSSPLAQIYPGVWIYLLNSLDSSSSELYLTLLKAAIEREVFASPSSCEAIKASFEKQIMSLNIHHLQSLFTFLNSSTFCLTPFLNQFQALLIHGFHQIIEPYALVNKLKGFQFQNKIIPHECFHRHILQLLEQDNLSLLVTKIKPLFNKPEWIQYLSQNDGYELSLKLFNCIKIKLEPLSSSNLNLEEIDSYHEALKILLYCISLYASVDTSVLLVSTIIDQLTILVRDIHEMAPLQNATEYKLQLNLLQTKHNQKILLEDAFGYILNRYSESQDPLFIEVTLQFIHQLFQKKTLNNNIMVMAQKPLQAYLNKKLNKDGFKFVATDFEFLLTLDTLDHESIQSIFYCFLHEIIESENNISLSAINQLLVWCETNPLINEIIFAPDSQYLVTTYAFLIKIISSYKTTENSRYQHFLALFSKLDPKIQQLDTQATSLIIDLYHYFYFSHFTTLSLQESMTIARLINQDNFAFLIENTNTYLNEIHHLIDYYLDPMYIQNNIYPFISWQDNRCNPEISQFYKYICTLLEISLDRYTMKEFYIDSAIEYFCNRISIIGWLLGIVEESENPICHLIENFFLLAENHPDNSTVICRTFSISLHYTLLVVSYYYYRPSSAFISQFFNTMITYIEKNMHSLQDNLTDLISILESSTQLIYLLDSPEIETTVLGFMQKLPSDNIPALQKLYECLILTSTQKIYPAPFAQKAFKLALEKGVIQLAVNKDIFIHYRDLIHRSIKTIELNKKWKPSSDFSLVPLQKVTKASAKKSIQSLVKLITTSKELFEQKNVASVLTKLPKFSDAIIEWKQIIASHFGVHHDFCKIFIPLQSLVECASQFTVYSNAHTDVPEHLKKLKDQILITFTRKIICFNPIIYHSLLTQLAANDQSRCAIMDIVLELFSKYFQNIQENEG